MMVLQAKYRVGGQVFALEDCGSSHDVQSSTYSNVSWAFYSTTVKSTHSYKTKYHWEA